MKFEEIKFNKDGLIPCVTQDWKDGKVLMVAYMNRESLEKTIKDGVACYYSRSRNKLWFKGEESGNIQKIKDIYIDCDLDTLLLIVEQIGNCACHKGYRSCFYRKWDTSSGHSAGWKEIDKKTKDPEEMYVKKMQRVKVDFYD